LGDGWTIVTRDHSLSAQWEHTILVTDSGYEVLETAKGQDRSDVEREAKEREVAELWRSVRFSAVFAVPLLLVPLPRWPGAGQRQGAGRA